MSATNIFVNISGTRVGFTGSSAVQVMLLCGVAGGRVTPIEISPEGWLLNSGTDLDI